MRESFGVREKGYFTPTQDEAVRHLLVSYTQGRNAILELLMQWRDDRAIYDESDPRRFAVAYAGAMVLVDAARFLKDTWNNDRLVIRKLNEAEPAFNIPPDTYQRIQKSLTDPYHAWLLYQAGKFYDQAREGIYSACSVDPDLQQIAKVLAALEHRVQVSKRQYAAARLQVRVQSLKRRLTDGTLLAAAYAVQEYVSRLIGEISVKPWHKPGLPESVRQEFYKILKPGDVIVVRKEHVATNYFLPGYWPHAAFYLGNANNLREIEKELPTRKSVANAMYAADASTVYHVMEAMKDGIHLRSTDSPFASDAVAIIRSSLSPKDIRQAICRSFQHEGKPYDFDFDFTRSDRMVCTEVVYRSMEGIGPIRFELTPRVGRMTLAAEDLLRMARTRQHFSPVAAYCPSFCPTIIFGDEVDALFDKTLQIAQ